MTMIRPHCESPVTQLSSMGRHLAILTVLSFLSFGLAACSDETERLGRSLIGSWWFEPVDEAPAFTPFEIRFQVDDGLFGADIHTACGMDGLLGDWTDIEVNPDTGPFHVDDEDSLGSQAVVSGSFVAKCIASAVPVEGYLIKGVFIDGVMVGSISYSTDRGNKAVGPRHTVTFRSLFIAKRS